MSLKHTWPWSLTNQADEVGEEECFNLSLEFVLILQKIQVTYLCMLTEI